MRSQKSRFQIHSSLNTSERMSTQNAYSITLLCMWKKVYQIPNTFPNGTLDFPPPPPPPNPSCFSFNYCSKWYHLGSCPKPNTQSVNKFSCLPSNYIQNLTTSHSLPLTPLLSLVILTRQLETLLFPLLSLLPPYSYAPHCTQRSLRIINLIMSHSCSKPIAAPIILSKISTLGSTQTLPLLQGLPPYLFHSNNAHSCFRASAPAASPGRRIPRFQFQFKCHRIKAASLVYQK